MAFSTNKSIRIRPIELWASTSSRSIHLPRHTPLHRIFLRNPPIIFPNLTRLLPQPLKLSIPILRDGPNALPQPLVPLPILLDPLLYLPLIQTLGGVSRAVEFGWREMLRIWGDWAEGGVGIFGDVVAFGEAGFDFEDGVGEEDGFLLETR